MAASKVLQSLKAIGDKMEEERMKVEENLERVISTLKRDIGEGYVSVVESFNKDLKNTMDKFQDDYRLLIEEFGKTLIEPLDKFDELSDNTKSRLNTVFTENVKKLSAIPTALEKAINESTKAITSEFLKIYEENMAELSDLENQTWVWLSKRILEAADTLIETSDRLKSLHSGLLDQISTRLRILQEYVLSLPTKLYSGMDREWRRFLSDSTKRFTELFELAKEDINKTKDMTIKDLDTLTKDILDAQVKGDIIFKESVMQLLNNSLKKAQSFLESVLDTLLKFREKINSNSDPHGFNDELSFAIDLLEKVSKQEINEELRRGLEYLETIFKEREKSYEKVLERYNSIISERIEKLLESVYESLSKTERGYINDLELLMESIKLIYSNQVDALNNLISDSINSIMESFKETQEKLDYILTNHSDTMVNIFRESTSEIKERIDQFLSEFKSKLEGLPQNYEVGIAKLAENTREALKSITNNMVTIVKEISKELEKGIDESRAELDKLKKTLSRANESFIERLDNIKKEIDDLTKELFEGGIKLVNEYLETIISDISNQFENLVSQYKTVSTTLFGRLDEELSSAVREGFETAKNELNKGFNELVNDFKKGLADLSETIDRVENAINTINQAEITDTSKGIIKEISERSYDFSKVIEETSKTLSDLLSNKVSTTLRNLLSEKVSDVSTLIREINSTYAELTRRTNEALTIFENLKAIVNEAKAGEVSTTMEEMEKSLRDIIVKVGMRIGEFLKKSVEELKLSETFDKRELDRIFTGINKVYMTLIAAKDEIEATMEKLAEKIYIVKNEKVIDEILGSLPLSKIRDLKVYFGYIDRTLIDILRKSTPMNIVLKARGDLAQEIANLLGLRRVGRGNIYDIILLTIDSQEVYIVKRSKGMRELIYISDDILAKAMENAVF